MRGRAGRKGRDTFGESYLCCNQTDLDAVKELIKAPMPRVSSCLGTEEFGMQRWVICSSIGTIMTSNRYLQSPLRGHSNPVSN